MTFRKNKERFSFVMHVVHSSCNACETFSNFSHQHKELEWHIKHDVIETINNIYVLKDLSYSSWEQMENTVIEGKTGLP